MLVYDARMIPNLKLCKLVSSIASDLGINLQLSSIEGGGTDGGAIHLHKTGVPTVVLAVPARHIHSHNSIINRNDYDSAVKLVVELITRLDAETVADLTM
jgi:endoglucanase